MKNLKNIMHVTMETGRMKMLPALIGVAWLIVTAAATAQNSSTPFFDDFEGTQLDPSRWITMEKAWGVNNGGVVRDNVTVSNGILHLTGHGDRYTGPVHGVGHKGQPLQRVTRVGAAIYTTNYFASGKYEVRMKLPPHLGACSALWTFHYEEAYPDKPLYAELARIGGLTVSNFLWIGLTQAEADSLLADLTGLKGSRRPYLNPPTNGIYHTTRFFREKINGITDLDLKQDFGKKLEICTVLKDAASLEPLGNPNDGYYIVRNQEIDIETPTGLKTDLANISYQHERFNTWVGQSTGEYTDNFDDLGQAMNDGEFHVFRFDWHTAGATPLARRVEFYVDDKCYQTNYTHIPTMGGRFTLGMWFPTWTGKADFDTQSLDVDWVRITPFNEAGDRWTKETD